MLSVVRGFVKRVTKGVLLIVVAVFCVNTSGVYQRNVAGEVPEPFDLKKGRSNFVGIITDEKAKIFVKKICFHDPNNPDYRERGVAVGEVYFNVLQPNSDFSSCIYLRDIKELEIIEKFFVSERHNNRTFCLVKIMFSTGVVENRLIHQNIQISACVEKTGEIIASYLYKINKIENIAVQEEKWPDTFEKK